MMLENGGDGYGVVLIGYVSYEVQSLQVGGTQIRRCGHRVRENMGGPTNCNPVQASVQGREREPVCVVGGSQWVVETGSTV